MTPLWTVVFLLAAAGGSNGQGPTQADWERADRETVRLKPSAFEGLSTSIADELERRGCAIPQCFSSKTAHNVIRGRFTTSAQKDVAVLCSKERISSILVFRGGSPASVLELAGQPDASFLQVVAADGAIGFSRKLDVATPKHMREHHDAHDGPQPPTLDHDGINDIFFEKGSVVWYWHSGQWLQLAGAD